MQIDDIWGVLLNRYRRYSDLQSSLSILGWDEQVNMPPGGAGLRGREKAILAECAHRELSHPELGEALAQLEARRADLDSDRQTLIRLLRKDYDRATKLPPAFIARKAEAETRAYQAWVRARQNDDFAAFAPSLQEQLDLCREEAALLEAGDAYDYFVDLFDPGMTSSRIDSLFKTLRDQLIPLVAEITNSPVKARDDIFHGFPVADQEAFLREVLHAVGFDWQHGRLDTAVHPFCSGHPRDTRLTTRYDPDNPLDSWSSALHEAGHGMYEQGMPAEWLDTPLGHAVGMAFHESQSRMWENQIGRSRAFWSHWEPRYRHYFTEQLKTVSSDELHLAINRVALTPIRVDADEVTYNLHIILRFEVEKALFRDGLAIRDIPEFWNRRSQEILGFRPKNNREGCLQDVHWSGGAFGYFPSYCLGNMLAAQIWYQLRSEIPDIDEKITRLEFAPILGWLREKVHRHGKRYGTNELIRNISGGELSPEFLVRYLRERYLPLYTTS